MMHLSRKDRIHAELPSTAPEMSKKLSIELTNVNSSLRELEAEGRAHITVPKARGVTSAAHWDKGPYPSDEARAAARPPRKQAEFVQAETTQLADRTIAQARLKPASWFSTLE